MLKVLLVDDEPFIIQGLKVLIDWEQEGYMIAGTASNGKEAYDFLKKESVDLIIAGWICRKRYEKKIYRMHILSY